MIAKRSKLKLLTSDILKSNIIFHSSSMCAEDVFKKMSEAEVDISYHIKLNKEGLYYIFVNVVINNEDTSDFGYSIDISGATVFAFEDDVSEQEKEELILSGVNISITNIRAYIKAVTSYYPLGSFSFHSIDMNALISEKEKTQAQKVK